MTADFSRAAAVILQGHRDRAYPAAVVEVGHAAGIVWRQAFGRLDYEPDSQSIYSDLGFILLGFALEDAGRASLDTQSAAMLGRITSAPVLFNPPVALRARIAPTERDPWRGRLLVGEVHDENCWALGGVAGHAGLFGTAEAVGDFARAMLVAAKGATSPIASRRTVKMFVTRGHVP